MPPTNVSMGGDYAAGALQKRNKIDRRDQA
jgi:hypothetical protein